MPSPQQSWTIVVVLDQQNSTQGPEFGQLDRLFTQKAVSWGNQLHITIRYIMAAKANHYDGAPLSSLPNSLPSAPFLVVIKHGKRKAMGLAFEPRWASWASHSASYLLQILICARVEDRWHDWKCLDIQNANDRLESSKCHNYTNHSPIPSNLDDLIIGWLLGVKLPEKGEIWYGEVSSLIHRFVIAWLMMIKYVDNFIGDLLLPCGVFWLM